MLLQQVIGSVALRKLRSRFHDDAAAVDHAAVMGHGVRKGFHAYPLTADLAQIHIRHHKIIRGDIIPVLVQHDTVLGENAVAREDHILCGFSGTGRDIEIIADSRCGGLPDQGSSVLPLGDQFIGCRYVHDQLCPAQCHNGGRGYGRPEILTDLHTQAEASVQLVDQMASYGYGVILYIFLIEGDPEVAEIHLLYRKVVR